MSELDRQFTGRSGHLAVMAEFRHRGSDFIVIRRVVLYQLQTDSDAGSIIRDNEGEPSNLMLRLVFTAGAVRNKLVNFQGFRGAFEPWPPPQPQ